MTIRILAVMALVVTAFLAHSLGAQAQAVESNHFGKSAFSTSTGNNVTDSNAPAPASRFEREHAKAKPVTPTQTQNTGVVGPRGTTVTTGTTNTTTNTTTNALPVSPPVAVESSDRLVK